MTFRHSAVILLLGAWVTNAPTGVMADPAKKNEQNVAREALRRGEVLPLVKILAIANRQVAGDIIEVELEDEKNALVYEIKILTPGGRVREINIDARTGAVLKIEDD